MAFYSFLAPKPWREWASEGLVQAFITALYVEVYGFPLAIYLLMRIFGIDPTHVSPNAAGSRRDGHDDFDDFGHRFGDCRRCHVHRGMVRALLCSPAKPA
jgi:hypothetical protein